MVNIRNEVVNLLSQENQVSSVAICSDIFTHLMEVPMVGISVH